MRARISGLNDEQLWALLPSLGIGPVRDYTTLLNLAPVAAESFRQIEANVNTIENIEAVVYDLLGIGNWRLLVATCGYLLFTGVTEEMRPLVWENFDSSWVAPQLAVVAYLKDDQFQKHARDRIEKVARGEFPYDAKSTAALIYLCKRLDSAQGWLQPALQSEQLRSFILHHDSDGGDGIAAGWLYRAKQLLGDALRDPEPVSADTLRRSGTNIALPEMSARMNADQRERFRHWAVQVAVRKLRRVLPVFAEHNSEDFRLQKAITAAEIWLRDGIPPSAISVEAVSALFAEVVPYTSTDSAIWNAVHKRDPVPSVAASAHELLTGIIGADEWSDNHLSLAIAAAIAATCPVDASKFVKLHYVDHAKEFIYATARRAMLRAALIVLSESPSPDVH
jgi:hypothetical protein